MAVITAADFRAAVKTRMKITGTEWTDGELDEAGRAAFNAAFPSLYRTVIEAGVLVTQNSDTMFGSCTVADSSRVYELVDAETDDVVTGWSAKNATTIRRIPYWVNVVDVSSIAPLVYQTVGNMTVPDEWLDALYTYAELNLVENLMGDMSTFRGQRPNSREGMPDEATLGAIQANLYNKWERERDEHALGLPPRVL